MICAVSDDTHARILSIADVVNRDAELVRRGRHCSTTFLLEAGETSYLVRVLEGRVAAIERGPFLMRPWTFALRAPADAWRRFWEPVPAPGYHDLFAMKKLGVASVEGDIIPLMTHLRYLKDLLAAPRRATAA
jgi:hypothetical protein